MAPIETLHCPFPSNVHPDASLVHEASVRWAQHMGLLTTEQQVRGALNAKVGWLAARGFPNATRAGLQLIADWLMLFCALDDRIEQRSVAETHGYLAPLQQALLHNTVHRDDPIERALIDVRKRLAALATAPALADARFVDALGALFQGYMGEAEDREDGGVPSEASYIALREVTSGIPVILSLIDGVEGIFLPDEVLYHAQIRRLMLRASSVIGWANDLFTYEKEIIRGEIHNLVLAVMTERGLPLADAVSATIDLHDAQVHGIEVDAATLPSFGAALDREVARYVDTLRHWVSGHLEWARETGRYQPAGVSSAQQRSMVVDESELEFCALADEPWPRLAPTAAPEAAKVPPRSRIDRVRARGADGVRLAAGTETALTIPLELRSEPRPEPRPEPRREHRRARTESERRVAEG